LCRRIGAEAERRVAQELVRFREGGFRVTEVARGALELEGRVLGFVEQARAPRFARILAETRPFRQPAHAHAVLVAHGEQALVHALAVLGAARRARAHELYLVEARARLRESLERRGHVLHHDGRRERTEAGFHARGFLDLDVLEARGDEFAAELFTELE